MRKQLQIIAHFTIPGKGLYGWSEAAEDKETLLRWGYWATRRSVHRETGIQIEPVFTDGKITIEQNGKIETIGNYQITEIEV